MLNKTGGADWNVEKNLQLYLKKPISDFFFYFLNVTLLAGAFLEHTNPWDRSLAPYKLGKWYMPAIPEL